MNFDGPVRVATTAGSGTASVTLSFDAWKEGAVAPTTHPVTVLPLKAGPKPEPVAANLVASLVHPDRKAGIWGVRFSPDGRRLFASGYPSGVVQIWDVAGRKELRRVETPAGLRGSADYAILSPDWKALYVPVERSTVKPIERAGKRLYRKDYSGLIRVWDLATGKEQEPIKPAAGTAPIDAHLAPGGRFLVSVERPGYDSDDRRPKDITVVLDLVAHKRWKLADGFNVPVFTPDGKTVILAHRNYETKTSTARAVDLATGKELGRLACPENERWFSAGVVSPDGSLVAVYLGGKKGAPLEVWFLDAKTLAERGKLVAKGDSEGYGWAGGVFTPGGRRFVVPAGGGNILVWDVAGRKLERTIPSGGKELGRWLAVGPDGKTVAVGWMPKLPPELQGVRSPDPQDLPQPRVSLIDLTGKAPPRVLIAPHGYAGRPVFSPDGKRLAVGSSGAVHLFDLTK